MKIAIIDCYIDEPASLGVPPFISPVVRYIIGAVFLSERVCGEEDVNYLTIDDLRKGFNPGKFSPFKADVVLLVSNLQVPGKYHGGLPASLKELEQMAARCEGKVFSWSKQVRGAIQISGEPDLFLYKYLKEGELSAHSIIQLSKKEKELRELFALKGAEHIELILKSDSYSKTYSICEIDTFKGCSRKRGCSFCPEWRRPLFSREDEDVLKEVKALSKKGITKFRLGGSCFFSYLSKELGKKDIPTPDAEALISFLKELSSLKPEVLHIDNANPVVLSTYPNQCEEVAKAVVRYCTPGNIASFGMESADPVVIKRNNINTQPEDVLKAVRILNKVGKKRGKNGMPSFLPGINLLYSLPGESEESFKLNYYFLKRVFKEGLLLRRINIRQVDWSFLSNQRQKGDEYLIRESKRLRKRNRTAFVKYKNKIREEIDRPMLRKVVPFGTVLRDVFIEKIKGNTSFGRQLATYPVLVGVPYLLKIGHLYNIKITSHGFRSVTGIEHPFYLNKAKFSWITSLPGVGKKRAARIFRHLPLKSKEEFKKAVGDEKLAEMLVGEEWVNLRVF